MRYQLIAQREACPEAVVAKGSLLQFHDGQSASPDTALAMLAAKVEQLDLDGQWPEGHDAVAELSTAEGPVGRWALVDEGLWEPVDA